MRLEDVTAILREHVDERLEAVSVARGPVGNGQETWFVDARGGGNGGRQLILRRSAVAGPLEWTDREQ